MTAPIWKACRSHEDFSGPYFDIDPEDVDEYAAKPFTSIQSATESIVVCHDLATIKPEHAAMIVRAPELHAAAQAMLDAFGGNVPDWLREPAERLQRAIEGKP